MKNFDPNNISFDTLLSYLFGEMGNDEESAFEEFLYQNPEYEDVIDGMRNFARENQAYDRKKFEQDWHFQIDPYKKDLNLFITKYDAQKNIKVSYNWKGISLGIAAGIIVGLLIGFFIGNSQNEGTETPNTTEIDSLKVIIAELQEKYDSLSIATEEKPILLNKEPEKSTTIKEWSITLKELDKIKKRFWETELPKHEQAGASENWISVFKSAKGNASQDSLYKVLLILDNLPDNKMSTKERYFRGCLRLFLTPSRTSAAISDLKMSQSKPNYEVYLLLAYAMDGQQQKASELLPKVRDVSILPESLVKSLKK